MAEFVPPATPDTYDPRGYDADVAEFAHSFQWDTPPPAPPDPSDTSLTDEQRHAAEIENNPQAYRLGPIQLETVTELLDTRLPDGPERDIFAAMVDDHQYATAAMVVGEARTRGQQAYDQRLALGGGQIAQVNRQRLAQGAGPLTTAEAQELEGRIETEAGNLATGAAYEYLASPPETQMQALAETEEAQLVREVEATYGEEFDDLASRHRLTRQQRAAGVQGVIQALEAARALASAHPDRPSSGGRRRNHDRPLTDIVGGAGPRRGRTDPRTEVERRRDEASAQRDLEIEWSRGAQPLARASRPTPGGGADLPPTHTAEADRVQELEGLLLRIDAACHNAVILPLWQRRDAAMAAIDPSIPPVAPFNVAYTRPVTEVVPGFESREDDTLDLGRRLGGLGRAVVQMTPATPQISRAPLSQWDAAPTPPPASVPPARRRPPARPVPQTTLDAWLAPQPTPAPAPAEAAPLVIPRDEQRYQQALETARAIVAASGQNLSPAEREATARQIADEISG